MELAPDIVGVNLLLDLSFDFTETAFGSAYPQCAGAHSTGQFFGSKHQQSYDKNNQ
jgi:hypothetical protein